MFLSAEIYVSPTMTEINYVKNDIVITLKRGNYWKIIMLLTDNCAHAAVW